MPMKTFAKVLNWEESGFGLTIKGVSSLGKEGNLCEEVEASSSNPMFDLLKGDEFVGKDCSFEGGELWREEEEELGVRLVEFMVVLLSVIALEIKIGNGSLLF